MQARWDRWLGKAEEELPHARAMADAYQRGREDAARTGSRTDARNDGRNDGRVTQPAHAGRAASDVTRAYPPQGNVPPGQPPRH